MIIQCPVCHSTHITTKDEARKAGGAIGAIGGGMHGVTSALKGAEVGRTVGAFAGPVGGTVGGIVVAFLGLLIGAVTGGVTGAKLGEIIDQRILDNYLCQSCGHSFSLQPHRDHSLPNVTRVKHYHLMD
jgi:hypothetical protein